MTNPTSSVSQGTLTVSCAPLLSCSLHGAGWSASAGVTSEQLVMACSCHDKEHWEREVEIRPGRQKRHPRVFGHLRRRRSPVSGRFGCQPYHELPDRPDEEPDA